ncbi:MAG: hypothetical protein A3K09_07850 [Nitrospinae bacterium RIFCSPLOWO2_12_FULL_47_7]|nr:MAG: hypothetical protein A3K09_07850 [Nitrospinae bacterium RIFCSPLOWO2_12_FULL_47_7]
MSKTLQFSCQPGEKQENRKLYGDPGLQVKKVGNTMLKIYRTGEEKCLKIRQTIKTRNLPLIQTNQENH